MSIILLIMGSLILLNVAWWYLSDRWLKPNRVWRTFNCIFLTIQFLAFVTLILGRGLGVRWEWSTPVMSLVYLWHLLLLPTLLVIGICAVPFLVFLAVTRKSRTSQEATFALDQARHSLLGVKGSQAGSLPLETGSTTQSRRQFLITAATVAPPLINIALTGYSAAQLERFRVRQMTLTIPDLPRALSGMTICHVTDLHVGPFTSEKVIRRVADRVNALQADLVFFTGDLINGKLTELPLGVDFIRSLESRFGTATIEGNHDLFEGRAAFENAFRAAGLKLLVNDVETFMVRDQPVEILGLRWGGPGAEARASNDDLIQKSMRELLEKRSQNPVAGAFPILLAHHPHAFDSAMAADLPLTLAGHTHGGQLMFNPQVGAGPLMFRYWSGLYQRRHSQLVVGNGVGNWFPLRTAAPAEIILLTLQKTISS